MISNYLWGFFRWNAYISAWEFVSPGITQVLHRALLKLLRWQVNIHLLSAIRISTSFLLKRGKHHKVFWYEALTNQEEPRPGPPLYWPQAQTCTPTILILGGSAVAAELYSDIDSQIHFAALSCQRAIWFSSNGVGLTISSCVWRMSECTLGTSAHCFPIGCCSGQ